MEFDNQLSRDVSTQHRRKTHRRKRSISKLSLSESEYSISRRSSQLQDELTKIALLESSESKAKTDSSVYITCSELCSGTCSYLSSISLNSALFPFNGRSLEYFNIKPRIFKNLIDIGIFKTSWIQERALPVLLRNIYKTCSIQSQSGTGKTLTYVITMLSKVNCTKPHCQILCIEPNAELVFQTLSVVEMLSEGLNELKLCSLKNDTSISKMPTITEHIVIAESGRNLQNCIECGKLNLSKLVLVIFDEADLIITNNRHQVITINLNTKKECQLFYFSATFNLEHKLFLHSISDNFYEISVDRKEMFLSTILQYYIKCKPEQKFIVTKIIYRHMKSGFLFVFVENKHSALNLSKLFNDQGIPNMYVLEENDIDDKLLVYKAAQCWNRGVIISTDTWARGIDLNPNVVVNYDLPNNIQDTCSADVYLHRIGRTGRFGKIGLAISLVHNFSQELFFKRLELRYGVLTNIMYLDVEDLKIIENCTEPKY